MISSGQRKTENRLSKNGARDLAARLDFRMEGGGNISLPSISGLRGLGCYLNFFQSLVGNKVSKNGEEFSIMTSQRY
jgi:hypothetical protein